MIGHQLEAKARDIVRHQPFRNDSLKCGIVLGLVENLLVHVAPFQAIVAIHKLYPLVAVVASERWEQEINEFEPFDFPQFGSIERTESCGRRPVVVLCPNDVKPRQF